MNPHPLSELLPVLSAADYARLRDDIKGKGLLQPITEHEGMILDGRHRWRACEELGVTPQVVRYAGTDPAGYLYSVNLAHRHLTKGQLAIAAAKLKAHYAGEAKKRHAHGLTSPGKSLPVRVPGAIGDARDLAGKATGVSGKAVDRAEAILKRGVPELIAKVESGEVSIRQGQQIARYPVDRQIELLKLPNRRVLNHVLKKSANMSAAKRRPRPAPLNPDNVPGTELVKIMLLRLELISSAISSSGLSPEAYAQTFLREFEWQEPLLVRRLSYAEPAIRCITTLALASQRAKKTAAAA
jgi:hypothetical protein